MVSWGGGCAAVVTADAPLIVARRAATRQGRTRPVRGTSVRRGFASLDTRCLASTPGVCGRHRDSDTRCPKQTPGVNRENAMTDERAFLDALLAAPADDTTRQVYADWLNESVVPGAAEKAEFLRLEAER